MLQCHRQGQWTESTELEVGGCEREGCLDTGALKNKECPSASELIRWSCRAEGIQTDNFLTVFPIPSLPLELAVASSTALCILAFLSGSQKPQLCSIACLCLAFSLKSLYLSLFPCLLTAATFSFTILMFP